jgi:hypothetical protein
MIKQPKRLKNTDCEGVSTLKIIPQTNKKKLHESVESQPITKKTM